jgi:hypothetical protein
LIYFITQITIGIKPQGKPPPKQLEHNCDTTPRLDYPRTMSMSKFNITADDDEACAGSEGHFTSPPKRERRMRATIKKYNTGTNYERTYVVVKVFKLQEDEEWRRTNQATLTAEEFRYFASVVPSIQRNLDSGKTQQPRPLVQITPKREPGTSPTAETTDVCEVSDSFVELS